MLSGANPVKIRCHTIITNNLLCFLKHTKIMYETWKINKTNNMTKERTISYHEHYVQVGFYQNFIKDKEQEIQKLKKQLQFTLESKDVLEAKLEVLQQNTF